MTYAEAINDGYHIYDTRVFRGYTSRKGIDYNQTVKTAKGNRAGEMYVELPNYRSTCYGTIRAYIRK